MTTEIMVNVVMAKIIMMGIRMMMMSMNDDNSDYDRCSDGKDNNDEDEDVSE